MRSLLIRGVMVRGGTEPSHLSQAEIGLTSSFFRRQFTSRQRSDLSSEQPRCSKLSLSRRAALALKHDRFSGLANPSWHAQMASVTDVLFPSSSQRSP